MLTFGIIIASDRSWRKEREDLTGPLLVRLCESKGWRVASQCVLPDDQRLLQEEMVRLADKVGCDVILTSGGTGLSERDVTPEATAHVIEKEISGISELMRREGMKRTRHAALSRAVAGVRNKTLIINLPGNPAGAEESFTVIADLLEHAAGLLKGEERHLDHKGDTA